MSVETYLAVRWCADCAGERGFEVPPCEDGHGADCVDLACTDCGAAIVVGVLVADDVVIVGVEVSVQAVAA